MNKAKNTNRNKGINRAARALCLLLTLSTLLMAAFCFAASAKGGDDENSIRVYFTLYGDTDHGSEVCHVFPGAMKNCPLWFSRKAVEVPEDSVVLDVFEKALTSADIGWTNVGGGYISEIGGLSEMDHGAMSGWMYYLNGISPMLGADAQPVKDKDEVVFFYTDDYMEQFSAPTVTVKKSKTFHNIRSVQFADEWEQMDPAKADEPAKDEPAKDEPAKDEPVKDEPVKDEPVKDEPKKEETAKEETGKDAVDDPENTKEQTRAGFVTSFWERAGSPYVNYILLFTDVDTDEKSAEAIRWASSEKLVKGCGNGLFEPDSGITREQAAAILYRYAALKGTAAEKDKTAQTKPEDISDVSEYAADAVLWALRKGLVFDSSEKKLSPKTVLTKGEAEHLLDAFEKTLPEEKITK